MPAHCDGSKSREADAGWTYGFALLGLDIGEMARFIMPGHKSGRVIVTTAVGIVGWVLGGASGRSLGWHRAGEPANFPMALEESIPLAQRLLISQSSSWRTQPLHVLSPRPGRGEGIGGEGR